MTFSCIIPAKDSTDPNLASLIKSIKSQDYPEDKVEIIIVTEGDSEEAKGIGIKRATGDICAMFCCDNLLTTHKEFSVIADIFKSMDQCAGVYTKYYGYARNDNSLNRYFSLMGNNDPVVWFLGKSDRRPHYEEVEGEMLTVFGFGDKIPSLGDNGFYFRKKALDTANLNRYYPMDVCVDMIKQNWNIFCRLDCTGVLHRTTDGNLLNFLKKRYIYARDLYCDRYDRRWKVVERREDHWKLALFVLASITFIGPLCTSIRGFKRAKDPAWFWHPIVCLAFTFFYGALVCRNLLRYRSLYQAPGKTTLDVT